MTEERDTKRQLKIAQREIERLRARLDAATDKQISLLDDVIELKKKLALAEAMTIDGHR
jgi:septal ring factor EnvC (AmiA/AmiB activator)